MPIYPSNFDPLFYEMKLSDLIKSQIARMKEHV
jgi:hypothetical protein